MVETAKYSSEQAWRLETDAGIELPDLELAVRQARNTTHLGLACQRVADALGFRHFQVCFRMPVSLTKPCQIVLTGFPRLWRERYDDANYLPIDPIVAKSIRAVQPFSWDEVATDSEEARQIMEDAARHGLRHGFTAVVHGSHGEMTMFSFGRQPPLPESQELGHLFRLAQWMAGLVHEKMRAIVSAGERSFGQHKALTKRERECLRYAAEGLSAPLIGRRINISEHTVNFHLHNAEIKLGARSRRNAVARAVAMGELDPGCYPKQLRQSQQIVELPTSL